MKNNNLEDAIIMSMNNEDNQVGYNLNEKDIDSVLLFLKENDPENATPERAIDFLASLKRNLRDNANVDLGADLANLYNEFKITYKK